MKDKGLIIKYFVLNPTKKDIYGKASRQAMWQYANIIYPENKELAIDIKNWVAEESGYNSWKEIDSIVDIN